MFNKKGQIEIIYVCVILMFIIIIYMNNMNYII